MLMLVYTGTFEQVEHTSGYLLPSHWEFLNIKKTKQKKHYEYPILKLLSVATMLAW